MHCLTVQKKKPLSQNNYYRDFPRDDNFSCFHLIVPQINQLLKIFAFTYDFIDFLEPTKDWLKYNGDLNNKLFWTDHLHLSKFGNKKFASSIFTLLQQFLAQLFLSLSFYLSVFVKLVRHVTLLLTSPLLRMENIPHRVII